MTSRAKRIVSMGLGGFSMAAGIAILYWLAVILTDRGYAVDNGVGYSTPLDTVMLVSGLALVLIPILFAALLSTRRVTERRHEEL
ncbi:hypothetical protein [Agromyces aureus]|nr:hypothetical protein [Agromyces aureus]